MSSRELADGRSHELYQFMEQISSEIGAEYDRIAARAREDPGTAGDEGEENWAEVFRDWLPATYHVVTKGRLISTSGETSPQVDVIVLHPSYPPALLKKKLFLASGVAAIFECKLTLRAHHIAEAIRTAASLRRMLPERFGSPYRELHSSLIYGLLAHSHCWNGARAEERIAKALQTADDSEVHHPREMLDVLCVANLATWSSSRMVFVGPSLVNPWTEAFASIYGPHGSATSSYIGPADHGSGPGNPIGVMMAKVLQHLAWEDPSLRPIADYWRLAGLWGSGSGAMRVWDPQAIYSPAVAPRVIAGADLMNGEAWNEWSMGF